MFLDGKIATSSHPRMLVLALSLSLSQKKALLFKLLDTRFNIVKIDSSSKLNSFVLIQDNKTREFIQPVEGMHSQSSPMQGDPYKNLLT